MTTPVNEPGLFDSHVDSYDDDCMRGLKLSGESRAYFARGRLEYLLAWWRKTRRPEPATVVDYGCGTGDVTVMLSTLFPRAAIVGLDPSPDSIERAGARHGTDRVRFKRLDHGAAARRAELIHINGVVHHVEPADRETVMRDIRNRTDEGGVLALFENNPLNPGTRLVMSRIPFDRDAVPVPPREARRLVRAAGFRIVRHRYLFYFPRFLRALRPLEPWLERIPLGAQYGILAVRD